MKLSKSILVLFFCVLAQALYAQTVDTITYKTVGEVDLKMILYYPDDFVEGDKCPTIVHFFGGGWSANNWGSFSWQAEYFARRGMIVALADYRVSQVYPDVTPFDCVKDAKSAMRFVKANAATLGVDPDKIVTAGGSAGGHLAAAMGTIEAYNHADDDLSISPVPNAMILLNPVVDNSEGHYGYDRVGENYTTFSPSYNVNSGIPPSIFFLGTADHLVPVSVAYDFQDSVELVGGRCDLRIYEGQGHSFYASTEYKPTTTLAIDTFLQSVGILTSEQRYNDLILYTAAGTGSEAGAKYDDESFLSIDSYGNALVTGDSRYHDWTTSGGTRISTLFGQEYSIIFNAMGTTNLTEGADYGSMLTQVGIDRASSGEMGTRGGASNGIDPNEGFEFGFDLSTLDEDIRFQVTRIGVYSVLASEQGVVVNRTNTTKRLTYGADDTDGKVAVIDGFIDVTSLDISCSGGEREPSVFSLFSTSEAGQSMRISSIELKIVSVKEKGNSISLTSTADGTEANAWHSDESPLGIDDIGYAYLPTLLPEQDWTISGDVAFESMFNHNFSVIFGAMATTNVEEGEDYGALLTPAGIDRAANGNLGIRGNTNGIDPNEGFWFGLDLNDFHSTIIFRLDKIALSYIGGSETGVIVNRKDTDKTLTFGASGTSSQVELTSGYVDVSDLDIAQRGGQRDSVLFSVFNTSLEEGSYRITGLVFSVDSSSDIVSTMPAPLDENFTEELIVVSPNPFESQLNIKYRSAVTTVVDVNLYTIDGVLFLKKKIMAKKGENHLLLETSSLPSCIYLCQIDDGNKRITKKIIKQ